MNDWCGTTILVCGVSGVGKTRLIQLALSRFPGALHWRASEIIGEARKISAPERLRSMPLRELGENQALLLLGFDALRRRFPDVLVLLDAHSVIDSDLGLFEVPAAVVISLRPSGIIHVEDAIESIFERRLSDTKRGRPNRTLAQIGEYQRRSSNACEEYRLALGVPLLRVRSGDVDGFERAVRQIELAKSDLHTV